MMLRLNSENGFVVQQSSDVMEYDNHIKEWEDWMSWWEEMEDLLDYQSQCID